MIPPAIEAVFVKSRTNSFTGVLTDREWRDDFRPITRDEVVELARWILREEGIPDETIDTIALYQQAERPAHWGMNVPRNFVRSVITRFLEELWTDPK